MPPLDSEGSPYITYAAAYIAMFAYAFAALANFGILARERVQVIPLFFVLLSVAPARRREARRADDRSPRDRPRAPALRLDDLWRAMTTADPTSLDLLRAVAAHGLPGAPPLPALPSDPQRWREMVALAERQRVLGLLVAVAEQHGLTDDEGRWSELLDLHRHWCTHDLRLERLLLRVADRLDGEGIDYVVLKGPALAHSRYRDPSLRLFADLDLLVPIGTGHRRRRQPSEILLDAHPELPELRAGFDDRFGKEVMLRTPASSDAPDGFEIDLHRTLVAGALGLTIPLDPLFDDTGALVLGGRLLPTLGPVPTLLAACYQASISDNPPRLAAARDLAQIITDDPPALDEVLAEARRWQGHRGGDRRAQPHVAHARAGTGPLRRPVHGRGPTDPPRAAPAAGPRRTWPRLLAPRRRAAGAPRDRASVSLPRGHRRAPGELPRPQGLVAAGPRPAVVALAQPAGARTAGAHGSPHPPPGAPSALTPGVGHAKGPEHEARVRS